MFANAVLTCLEWLTCVGLLFGLLGLLVAPIRGIVAIVLHIGYFVGFVLTLLWCCAALAYTGGPWLWVGLFLGVVGVFPVALVRLAIIGQWGGSINIILMIFSAALLEVVSRKLIRMELRRRERLNPGA